MNTKRQLYLITAWGMYLSKMIARSFLSLALTCILLFCLCSCSDQSRIIEESDSEYMVLDTGDSEKDNSRKIKQPKLQENELPVIASEERTDLEKNDSKREQDIISDTDRHGDDAENELPILKG